LYKFTLKVNNTAGFVAGEEAAKVHPGAASTRAVKLKAHISSKFSEIVE
jgi:hypothetical protein